MRELIKKVKSKKEKKKLVKTQITIGTSYLEKETKQLYNYNVRVSILALLSALITSITTITSNAPTLWNQLLNIISGSSKITSSFIYKLLIFLIGISMLLLSIVNFFKQRAKYNPTQFVNRIVKDQYDIEEFTAIFVIKAIFDNKSKILVFRSETWNSYFLPYCHYNEDDTNEEIKENSKSQIADILEIQPSDFDIFDDFTKNNYVTIKKNLSHDTMSKINYRFFYLKFNNPYVARKLVNSNTSHFSWKSKYELGKDIDTKLNNGDVVSIISELSLIDQSQLAFQEKMLVSSYELSNKYNIIWNITNDCYYNCPICATNSGNGFNCPLKQEDKMTVLYNLASINGFIEKIDFSGGDPLKNQCDREVIKAANKLLAFTDIHVTTTGEALEKLSINELNETVKKCDITYDAPFDINDDELKNYRDNKYNYSNFTELERFSKSGLNIELNIHMPILPLTSNNNSYISIMLRNLSNINPNEIKFIRFMPVGRNEINFKSNINSIQSFLTAVSKEIKRNNYNFDFSYNCSLGNAVKGKLKKSFIKTCRMGVEKLGIDCNGRVYSCIWGAYINEFSGENYINNPFYMGNLKEETMYEILTKPETMKYINAIKNKKAVGCRVCAYVNHQKENHIENISKEKALEIMLSAEDPLTPINEIIL